MTLFEELQLLKEFEKRENVLAAKVDVKIKERSDMQAKVSKALQDICFKLLSRWRWFDFAITHIFHGPQPKYTLD